MVTKPQHDETAVGKIIRVRRELQHELETVKSQTDPDSWQDGYMQGLRYALNKL